VKNALAIVLATILIETSLYAWQDPQRHATAAESNADQNPASAAPSEKVTLNKGTPVCLLSTQRMSTKTARLNDRILFWVPEDIKADGVIIVPRRTEVWATVTEVHKPGRHINSAWLSFSFAALPILDGRAVSLRQNPHPKDGLGSDIKDTWDVGGPWLMPLFPLIYLEKEQDEVLTKTTCVWTATESDIILDRAEALRLQPAASHSDTEPMSFPGAISANMPVAAQCPQPCTQPAITEIAVGFGPGPIAFTPGATWVSWGDYQEVGLSRIDANTGKVTTLFYRKTPVRKTSVDPLPIPYTWQPGSARSLAASEGSLWLADGDKSVSRIDPETSQVIATIPLAEGPGHLAAGEGAVWVTHSRSISRIDPRTNAVTSVIRLKESPDNIAVGAGAVWVVHPASIYRIDLKTNTTGKAIPLFTEGKNIPLTAPDWPFHVRHPVYPNQVTVQGNDVWVTASDEAVLRIDARSGKIVARIRVPPRKDFFALSKIVDGQPRGAAVLDGFLWVADSANQTLWKIDMQTNKPVGEPVLIGFHPVILGPGNDGNGAIWISNESDGTVMKIRP